MAHNPFVTVDRVARLAESAGFNVRFDRAELHTQVAVILYLEREGVSPFECHFYRPTTLASFHWSGAFHRTHWQERTGPQPEYRTIKALAARLSELAGDAARQTDADELVELLQEYGRAKLGDDWWPGEPYGWLPDDKAARLVELLGE